MIVKAYAKINLYLDVLGNRSDGFHELEMVMLPIELHDTIEIDHLPNSNDTYVVCDHVDLTAGQYNLIYQTYLILKDRYKKNMNFNIHVHKEIPISAGLGGGSANAAAALKALPALMKINMSFDEQLKLGEQIGSDVPFCLYNCPAVVTGRGEKIERIKMKKQYNVLILKPRVGLSTKEVFAISDTIERKHGNIKDVVSALENGDDELLATAVFNGLEDAAITALPEVKEYRDMLIKDGLKIVLMSGSGSSVYALTSDNKLAKSLFNKYEKQGYEVILTKTLK